MCLQLSGKWSAGSEGQGWSREVYKGGCGACGSKVIRETYEVSGHWQERQLRLVIIDVQVSTLSSCTFSSSMAWLPATGMEKANPGFIQGCDFSRKSAIKRHRSKSGGWMGMKGHGIQAGLD